MRKLLTLCHRFREIGSYLFFGILTTTINYFVYLLLLNGACLSGAISNAVAWAAAVIFAFLTNKPFVFHSHDWSAKTVIAEFTRFVSCRFISGVAETVLIFLLVDILMMNGNVIKLIISVLVVIMNYITGKWFAFPK